MTESNTPRVTQARDELALAMLAAWLNVRPDQIPAENRAHTCAHTMAAWQRVGEAARLQAEAASAATVAEFHRHLTDLCAECYAGEGRDAFLAAMEFLSAHNRALLAKHQAGEG